LGLSIGLISVSSGNCSARIVRHDQLGERKCSKWLTPNPLHPILQDGIANVDPAKSHYSKKGAHAEVYALNEALLTRDPRGTKLTESDLKDFTIMPVWLSGDSTDGGMSARMPAPRCGNCTQITDGINNLSGDAPPQPEFTPRKGK
jgi:hypothetical protein